MATSPSDAPDANPAPDAPPGRAPLAVAFGRRVEEAESGLDETETALRHLAHDVADTERWLQRARAGLASAREAIRWVPHPPASAREGRGEEVANGAGASQYATNPSFFDSGGDRGRGGAGASA